MSFSWNDCYCSDDWIVVGNLFQLGVNSHLVAGEATIREVSSLVDTLRGLLPSNPISAMADGNVVAVVIFAAFLGLATKRQTKKYYDIVKPFIDLVEAFYKIILSVAMTIIKWMPYAVIALLANTIAGRGMAALGEAIDFILVTYIGVALMFGRAFNFNCLKRIKSIPLCEKCFRCLSFSFYVTFITWNITSKY